MDNSFRHTSQRCNIKFLNLYCHFFVLFLSTELQPFFMHNKWVLIFLLISDLVSVFPLCLKHSVADTSKFSVLRKEKTHKTNTTEWHNELKLTENEFIIKICLLTLYLNHFNENKLMFGRTLKNFFIFLLQHSKVNLQT